MNTFVAWGSLNKVGLKMQVTGCMGISEDGRRPPKPHLVGSEGQLLLIILNMKRTFWMLPRLVLIKPTEAPQSPGRNSGKKVPCF